MLFKMSSPFEPWQFNLTPATFHANRRKISLSIQHKIQISRTAPRLTFGVINNLGWTLSLALLKMIMQIEYSVLVRKNLTKLMSTGPINLVSSWGTRSSWRQEKDLHELSSPDGPSPKFEELWSSSTWTLFTASGTVSELTRVILLCQFQNLLLDCSFLCEFDKLLIEH